MEAVANKLLKDLNKMLSEKERGYGVAQKLNDEFWEELGIHRKRLQEQINYNNSNETGLKINAMKAESIYNAAREFIAKYKGNFSSR